MIDLKQAFFVVKNKFKKDRIVSCEEYDDSYGFWIMPRTWDGEKKTCPCGCNKHLVNKTSGEITSPSFDEFMDYIRYRDVKQVDITRYLSDEDREFSRKVLRRLEEEKRLLDLD